MIKAARAIIVHNQNILLMKRNKFGHVYYTLLGGGIEMNETADQAAIREVQEEAGIRVTNPRLVYVEDAGAPYGTQYVFVCDYQDGDIRMDPSAPEMQLNKLGKNTYEAMWVPVSKLSTLPFRSTVLLQELLHAFRDGFPREPKMLTSRAEISYTRPEADAA